MANAEAWAEGAAIGTERAQEKRAHKQALSDAQFQEKHNEIQGMIENLARNLLRFPKITRNTPDYLKMQDQLAQAIQDRNAHWKSVDQPNALIKFGKMLGKDLRFKKQEAPVPVAPPVYGQPTIQTPASQGEIGNAFWRTCSARIRQSGYGRWAFEGNTRSRSTGITCVYGFAGRIGSGSVNPGRTSVQSSRTTNSRTDESGGGSNKNDRGSTTVS